MMKPPYKPVVHALCLLPLALIVLAGFGATNPIEAVLRGSGDWALRLLLVALAVSPVRRLTGIAWIAALRRMLGLYAFFYVSLHLLIFVALDQGLDIGAIAKAIVKQPYITVGMLAFALLVPLAVTSTNRMVRRLGGRNWQRLHKLAYAIAPLGILHFYWMKSSKNLTTEPLIYAAICALLLGERLFQLFRRPLAR